MKTAEQINKLLQEQNYFKFLWTMYDELTEDEGENSGTIIGRYAHHLEQNATK